MAKFTDSKFAKSLVFIIALGFISSSAVLTTQADNNLAQAVSDREAELKASLAQTEEEIASWQKVITEKQAETSSIQRDIDILTAQIKEAQLIIKAKNISIERLGKDIGTKVQTIETLSQKLEKEKESLAQLVRKTNQIDLITVPEMVLSKSSVSETLLDLDSYQMINRSINESWKNILILQEKTSQEKNVLNNKRDEEMDIKAAIELQKRKIEKSEKEKDALLRISKNQEKSYQTVLADKQKKAAQIRAALFGLRDTAAIPFGTALSYAVEAQKVTGVRPAFLLAILKQETNLGENIGTCNRPQDPPEKHWKEIMKPSRDHAPYLEITGKLGLDPNNLPLSCPWGGGWGGAMGPSQFIPSTWMMYLTKISKALGGKYPSPWDPKDAFMASAIYLSELGAGAGTFSAERTAALKYYAGGNWYRASNAFYGNQVMAKAVDIQENMIDPLQN